MRKLTATLLLLIASTVLQAAYVTDKLLAGFYTAPDNTQEPAKVLPSGTPVEILENAGDMVRVRLGEGREGWMETGYLTDEKPARVMLLELQAKNRNLQQMLKSAEEEVKTLRGAEAPDAAPQPTNTAEDSKLRQELQQALEKSDQLQAELDKLNQTDVPQYREQITKLEASLEEARGTPQENEKLQALRDENSALKQRLDSAAQALGLTAGESVVAVSDPGYRFNVWHLTLAAVIILLSFIAGIAFKNYRISRRYGGFRI
jgi:SH3 domain protein